MGIQFWIFSPNDFQKDESHKMQAKNGSSFAC